VFKSGRSYLASTLSNWYTGLRDRVEFGSLELEAGSPPPRDPARSLGEDLLPPSTLPLPSEVPNAGSESDDEPAPPVRL
jgi:hypothetical protein